MQLAAGIALGLAIAAIRDWAGDGVLTGDNALLLLPTVAALMTLVGLVAAVAPARRGLAVQPVEALRED